MSVDLSNLNNFPLVVFIGAPGSGKGTHSALLANKFHFELIDMGGLLRAEAKKSTPRGIRIAQLSSQGVLVPLDDVFAILSDSLANLIQTGAKGLILDGFPRNLTQMELLEIKICPPRLIFYLNANEETIRRRLEIRKRPDDTPTAIANRLESFKVDTIPIVDKFKSRGNFMEVDSSRSIDEVDRDLTAIWIKTFPVEN